MAGVQLKSEFRYKYLPLVVCITIHPEQGRGIKGVRQCFLGFSFWRMSASPFLTSLLIIYLVFVRKKTLREGTVDLESLRYPNELSYLLVP